MLGPRFPMYDDVRAVMRVVAGYSRAVVTTLPPALAQAGITDDVDPESAEGQRLIASLDAPLGDIVRDLWRDTQGHLHPRGYIAAWSLARMHDLLTDEDVAADVGLRSGRSRLAGEPDVVVPFARGAERAHAPLRPTAEGASFLEHPDGEVERRIDEREGLVFVGTLLTESDLPTELLQRVWSNRWKALAGGRMEGRDLASRTLGPRLDQLVERGLIERTPDGYVATPAGRARWIV